MLTGKSFVLPLFLSVSCIIAAPLTVHGQGSRPTPVDPTPSTQSGLCAFDVELSLAGKGGTINLPGGAFIVTSPGLDATVTNLSDPSKSVTLNITGAFHQSIQNNGDTVTVATGRSLLFDPVAGFVLAMGTFTFVVDANGELVESLAGHGQLTDVCKLLS